MTRSDSATRGVEVVDARLVDQVGGGRQRRLVAGPNVLPEGVGGLDEGVRARGRNVAPEGVDARDAVAEALEGVSGRTDSGFRPFAPGGDGCPVVDVDFVGFIRISAGFQFVEEVERVAAVRLDRAHGRHSPGFAEGGRDLVGGRSLAVVGAGEQFEEVLAVGVGRVPQPLEAVDGLQQLAGSEIGTVEGKETSAVDESAFPAVLPEVRLEFVDSRPGKGVGRVADPLAVGGEVERDGSVGVRGAGVHADAAQVAAARTRDGARLVVRPPRAAGLTLAFAADFHAYRFVASALNDCGSVASDRGIGSSFADRAGASLFDALRRTVGMNWLAVDALDRAVDATRRFLFPFEAVRWVKLAFLALVMAGGTAGASRVGASHLGVSAAGIGLWTEISPTGVGPMRLERVVGTWSERVAGLDDALIVAIAIGALLVGVALAVCSVAFRLVFYDALAATEVALWRPLRDRFRQALGLFGFATTLAVASAIPAVAFVVALGPGAVRVLGVSVGGFSGLSTAAIAALGAFSAVIGVIGALGGRFTFEFVAPTMVARDVGVLAGWRRVWDSLRGTRIDLVAYLAVHAVVAAGVGFVQAVAVAFVGGVVAVVALVALALAAVPLGGLGALIGTSVGTAVLATVLVCAVAAVVALSLPVRLVARTYLIAYEVSTLAGIDPDSAPLGSALVSGAEPEVVGDNSA